MFVLFKYGFAGFNAQGKWSKAILNLSKCSFGVYLAHPLFIEHLPWPFGVTAAGLAAGVMLSFAGSYLLSLLVSFVLNRIPVLKRYIV